MAEDGLSKIEDIFIFVGKPIAFDEEGFLRRLEKMMLSAYANKQDIRDCVEDMVPTYHPE